MKSTNWHKMIPSTTQNILHYRTLDIIHKTVFVRFLQVFAGGGEKKRENKREKVGERERERS